MKKVLYLILAFVMLEGMVFSCTLAEENKTDPYLYAEDYTDDSLYESLNYFEEEKEWRVEIPPEQLQETEDIALYVFREYEDDPECYTYMTEERKLEVGSDGYIHIPKDQELLGIWDENDQRYLPVSHLDKSDEDGTTTWKKGNFCLVNNEYCDFLYEHSQIKLVVKEKEEGIFCYELNREKLDNNPVFDTGNMFGLAEGDRKPVYTSSGILKEFASWGSNYVSVSMGKCDLLMSNLQFRKMKLSDYPENTFVCQIVAFQKNGGFLTTDLMMLQEKEPSDQRTVSIETSEGAMDFIIENGEAVLTRYRGNDVSIVVPGTVDDCTVTGIEDGAFYNTNLSEVVLPEGLKRVGEAFELSSINSIHIPAGVEEIAEGCFGFCDELTRIQVDEDNPVFMSKDNCLYSRDGRILYRVSMNIEGAFAIPAGVEEIGKAAFTKAGITEVIFPDTLRRIGINAFYSVPLEKLVFPEQLEIIGMDAFSGDENLLDSWGETEELSENERSTGVEIQIGKNVKYIGPAAFCGLLVTGFQVAEENVNYKSVDGLILTKDGTYLMACPTGKSGDVRLPEGIIVVNEGAFENNGDFQRMDIEDGGIKNLTLSSTIEYFYMNDRLKNLENLTLNDSLQEIDGVFLYGFGGKDAVLRAGKDSTCYQNGTYLSKDQKKLLFYYDSNKPQLTYRVPETVTEICHSALQSSYIRELVFPAGLTLADMSYHGIAEALKKLPALEKIVVEPGNPYFTSVDGVLYNKDLTILICYPQGKTDTEFSVPEGVKAVAGDGFYGNQYVEKLKLPASLAALQLNADYRPFLSNLQGLTSLEIAEESPNFLFSEGVLVSRGDKMVIFYVDTGRETVTIPDGTEGISSDIYFSCSSDDWDPWFRFEVILPDSLREIQGSPFDVTQTTLIVGKGSYGEKYAIENGINYEIAGNQT